MARKIDIETWNRREPHAMFSALSYPFYSVTFPVDVTGLRGYVRREGLSFYLTMVWLVARSLDEVENFRYKIRPDGVWLVDRLVPSFTDMKPGAELFRIVTCPTDGTPAEFCRRARALSAA